MQTHPPVAASNVLLQSLKRSTDRKVTNHVRVAKSGSVAPVIANSIGLPSGADFSCGGMTSYCGEICYAGKLERIYKGVSAVLLHNWELLSAADYATMVRLLSAMISDFVADCRKHGAEMNFRIHWDGDFFSGVYTAAWSAVIAANPAVQFWVYTRVASAASFLHSRQHGNLSLYFSADRDNVAVARTLSEKGMRIAYVAPTFSDGKAEFASAVRCPENNSRKLADGTQSFPLISAEGSACQRCGLCIHARRDVLFSASKK